MKADALRRARRVSPRGQHVAAGGQRQPEVVVGAARAHAAVQRRMPPVLHVAFAELVRGAQQQLLRAAVPARRARAPSHPAAGRGSRTRRRTGSSRCAPTCGRRGSGRAASRWPARRAPGRASAPARRRASAASARAPRRARRARLPVPRKRWTSARGIGRVAAQRRGGRSSRAASPSASSNGDLERRARIQRRAEPARTVARGAAPPDARRLPLRPRNSLRSPLMPRLGSSTSKNATRSGNSVLYALRANSAPLCRVELGDHVHRGLRRAGRRAPTRRSRWPTAGAAGPSRCAASAPRTSPARPARRRSTARSGCRPRRARTRCSRSRGA